MDSPETLVAPVGLTLLSDPPEAVIDIVFVHGLQGHPQETWTLAPKPARKFFTQMLSPFSKVSNSDETGAYSSFRLWSKLKRTESRRSDKEVEVDTANDKEEETQGNAVFWPKDLLSEDFPRARVMTFGYDTSITKGYRPAHQGNIFSHARDLLYTLEQKRRKSAKRDLVFIAHSLGGILVKEVLRRSEVDPNPNINKIFMSTTGVFFFGTPHRGSKDWASFGEGMTTVASLLLRVDTNNEVIHALLPSSSELELCRESFAVQWVKRGDSLMVRTFQESKGITGINWRGFNQLIVPPDSSTLDHPNQRSRTIDADHGEMVRFSGKNDGNYEMVRDDIEELVMKAEERAGKVLPELMPTSLYHLPLSRNRHFVGRSAALNELMQKMFVNKECQKMALVGLGGIGKTQVALQFAYSVKDKQPDRSIFWVPALSLESFEQAYAEIARILRIPQTLEDKGDIKELVKQRLSARTAGKWLLIIDNVDNMNELYGTTQSKGVVDYLPESDDGLTLFTSRHQRVAQSLVGSDVLELEKMMKEEAVNFLKSLVRKDLICDNAITTELLIELDYLPLAISQAAAYINTKKTSISMYLWLLRKTTEDVIGLMSEEFRDNTRYKNSANAVATTWVVSFNQILEDDAIAADLLAFMSCIEWKAIPRSILPAVRPEARMDSAIGTICSYSFLVRRNNEDVYDMHRLVHLATRIWVQQHGRGPETSEKAMKHLAKVFPSSDSENCEIWRDYLPHAIRLSKIKQGKSTQEKYKLTLKVGQCLLEDGRTGEAVMRLQESYRWGKSNLLKTHPDRLASQHELACAYQANGQVKEAVELLEEVVKIERITLAEDRPDRLASQHALAYSYQANGQVNEAVKLLEEVVKIEGIKLAEDHPARLASQHELARAYAATGQVEEAVELLEDVVKIGRTTLAKDHFRRLTSQHELACTYQANGQVKEAVELLEEVVKIERTTLAEDHPARLASQHELACAYQANGQVKEAVKLLEEVVKIKGNTLAEDHPDRLVSQHALAYSYHSNRQVKEAVELLEEVVKIKRIKLAKNHPARLASQHELARAYAATGKLEEAVKPLEDVVKIGRTTLSKDHPDRVLSEELLAYCLRET